MNSKEQSTNYYVASIRHELRTPINAIIGYSEMLIEDLAEEDSDLIYKLEKILVGGDELLSIIKKILEPLSINSRESSLNLAKIWENTEIELSPSLGRILDHCQVLLEKTKNSEVNADISRIKQAGINLQTLIQNKTLFPETSLTDNLEKQSDLNQNDPDDQITIEQQQNEQQNIESSKYHQGNILIVDDNENNRELLSRQLKKEGYTFAQASGGRQALGMIGTGDYDLVLLDLLMPELNGYQVLEELKANSLWQHIPVIMISALDELDSIIKCIEIGAEDYLPKPFNPILLKARIGASLEKKRLRDLERQYLQQVEEYSQKLNQDLEIGRTMQQNFLPANLLDIPGWKFASFFKPARQVAGDFYDMFELQENNIGLVIADVCDKGVGAALFMALFRSLIRIFSSENKLEDNLENLFLASQPPTNGWLGEHNTNLAHFQALQSVALTNNYVAENHGDLGMFATLFFGILEPKTGLLTYINGGHEPLFILNAEGKIKQQLHSTGPAVGMLPYINFNIQQLYLQSGDILFGYTDGVTEARSINREFFTDKRLEVLLRQSGSSAIEVINHVSRNLLDYIGEADQFDDITMLAVQKLEVR